MMRGLMGTMAPRSLLPLVLAAVLTATGSSSVARADDDGHRFGLVGLIGGGIAGVAHPGPLSSFIGFTDLGVEILGEVRPWGGFLRGEYLSSGDTGRWTAFSFSGGVEYRLFGDARHTALFLRGGLAYERWSGTSGGCPVDFLVPDSCNLLNAQGATFQVSTDMLGVIAGARLEAPISPLFLAVSGNVVPAIAVDSSNPAAALELRFTLEVGFRDRRTQDDAQTRVPARGRSHTEYKSPSGE
jgi:hypothetical protein